MALRLRRGTDAQRLLITPLEGELIYTTDTKRLYIGDGTTLGGVGVNTGAVYGLDDLTDVDLTTAPEVGEVLKYDGFAWVAAPESAFTPSGDYNIDIANLAGDVVLSADGGYLAGNVNTRDGTAIVVDVDNGHLFGTLYGSLDGIVNGTLNGTVNGVLNGDVVSSDGLSVIVDGSTGDIFGRLLGNVEGTVNGTLNGTVNGDLNGNVVSSDGLSIVVDNATGDVFGRLLGNVIGNVTGDVSGNVVGNLTGFHNGDSKGSVFADDSSIMVDSVGQRIFSRELHSNSISIYDDVVDSTNTLVLKASDFIRTKILVPMASADTVAGNPLSAASLNTFEFEVRGRSIDTPVDIDNGDMLGAISFNAIQTSGSESPTFLAVQADPQGTITATHVPTKFFFVTQPSTEGGAFGVMSFDSRGRLGINQVVATATLDVVGNAKISSSLQVSGGISGSLSGSVTGDLKGSVFADDSTMLIDGINGNISAKSVAFFNGASITNENNDLVVDSGVAIALALVVDGNTFVLGNDGSLTFPDDTVQTGASISIAELKTLVAAAATYADFQTAIAAL